MEVVRCKLSVSTNPSGKHKSQMRSIQGGISRYDQHLLGASTDNRSGYLLDRKGSLSRMTLTVVTGDW